MTNNRRIGTVIFDMEGVIFRTNTPFPFAAEVLRSLREAGYHIGFLTNASVHVREEYVEKLSAMGITCSRDQIMTASYATAAYFRNHRITLKTVFIVGGSALVREFSDDNNRILTPQSYMGDIGVDYVVVGFYTDFNYETLVKAQQAILRGAHFIATDLDPLYPHESGAYLPAVGWQIAAITLTTNKRPFVIGKPETYSLRLAIEQLGGSANTTLLVGDNLWSDILAGNRLGCYTCHVLSGVPESRPGWAPEAEAPAPDFVVKDISYLEEILRQVNNR